MNIKILAIGDESNDKTRIIDYEADEFALKPLSPENVADKILMLLARETVDENRSSGQSIYYQRRHQTNSRAIFFLG